MRALLLAAMLLMALSAEENPFIDSMEEAECWAEVGAPCEVAAEEWADEHESDDVEEEENENDVL